MPRGRTCGLRPGKPSERHSQRHARLPLTRPPGKLSSTKCRPGPKKAPTQWFSFTLDSDHRRTQPWSPRRVVELRELGGELVANARRHLEPTCDDESTESDVDTGDSVEQQLATVRAWASCLDRATYRAYEGADGLYVQAAPPEDVVQALQHGREHLESAQEAFRLVARYGIGPWKGGPKTIDGEELEADIAVARRLFDDARSSGADGSWDAPALVAATALEAQFVDGTDVSMEALSFAANTVLRIGECEPGRRPFDVEETYFEDGADRSAARALPLLLLPIATKLRELAGGRDETAMFDRTARACIRLARAVPNEVRLHLARGLDHVWDAPCAEAGSCHTR